MEHKFKDVVTGDVMPMEEARSVVMEFRFRVDDAWPCIVPVGFSSLEADEANGRLKQRHSAMRRAFDKDAGDEDITRYFMQARERRLKEEILSLEVRISNKLAELKKLEKGVRV